MRKNAKYYEYIGCVHIHTTYSDGSKSLEDVAAIADSVGLDYILISDHMTLESREAGKEGYYGKTLTLIGYEHNDREDCNHYLLFGTKSVLPEDMSPVDYVAEGARQGALGIIAHPDEIRPRLGKYPSYPWLAWDAREFDAIEIWNQMSEWMENLKPYNKLKMLFSPRKFLQTPTDRILKKWDELNVEHKIAGIGAIDVHGFPYKLGPIRITIFPYKVQFKSLRTHLLLPEKLYSDISRAKKQIYDAIRDCRVFASNYRWGDAAGFEFYARQGGRTVISGGRLENFENSKISAKLPEKGEFKLIRDGSIVLESHGDFVEYSPNQNGLYRIEVYKKGRGWIYSNHIRIGA